MTERGPSSPLELLLPEGVARGVLVLGSACPPRLRPATTDLHRDEAAEATDLVVIAPGAGELREPRWLESAVERGADVLSRDGLVYVLVPPRSRRRARALLRKRGLDPEWPFLHLPDSGENRHLVPLEPEAARHAFAGVVPLVPWKRVAVGALLRAGGARALALAADDVAFVARRPRAAPPFAWLTQFDKAPEGRRAVVITASWRPNGPHVVLEPFPHGPAGPCVAKLALDGEPTGEQARLAQLGETAGRAGARVPEPLAGGDVHGAPVMLESRLSGRLAAPLLARRKARLTPIASAVATWLASWHRLTTTPCQLDRDRLERELLGPAEAIAPALDGGAAYLDRLAKLCLAAEGTTVALVATHNDLTMWNVLVDGDGHLGIVDWESAEPAALPLKDFFYATVDAVAATNRYRDRPGAVRDCFEPHGAHAALGDLQASVAAAAGAGPEVVALAFHATWLGHAASEARSAAASDERPFLEIAQGLVRRV